MEYAVEQRKSGVVQIEVTEFSCEVIEGISKVTGDY